jgi:hypothetical protein
MQNMNVASAGTRLDGDEIPKTPFQQHMEALDKAHDGEATRASLRKQMEFNLRLQEGRLTFPEYSALAPDTKRQYARIFGAPATDDETQGHKKTQRRRKTHKKQARKSRRQNRGKK